MKLLLRRLVLLLLLVPVPASGADDRPCWSPDAAPELFGWTAAPSRACRDSAAEAAQRPLPAPAFASSQTSAQTPGPATRTRVFFSGSAQLGIAARF